MHCSMQGERGDRLRPISHTACESLRHILLQQTFDCISVTSTRSTIQRMPLAVASKQLCPMHHRRGARRSSSTRTNFYIKSTCSSARCAAARRVVLGHFMIRTNRRGARLAAPVGLGNHPYHEACEVAPSWAQLVRMWFQMLPPSLRLRSLLPLLVFYVHVNLYIAQLSRILGLSMCRSITVVFGVRQFCPPAECHLSISSDLSGPQGEPFQHNSHGQQFLPVSFRGSSDASLSYGFLSVLRYVATNSKATARWKNIQTVMLPHMRVLTSEGPQIVGQMTKATFASMITIESLCAPLDPATVTVHGYLG